MKHQHDQRELRTVGDYLLVSGDADNTVIYKMATMTRIGEVYGEAVGGDEASDLLVMTNRRNEVFLLQASTAHELARFTLPAEVRVARLMPAQKQLLVLTSAEKVYTFDTSAMQRPHPETTAVR